MKKIYLLLLFTVFSLSCSKDDDNSNSEISINPPEWIHGTWKASSLEFKFTSNDVIFISGVVQTSHREQLSTYSKAGGKVSVEENFSPDEYEVLLNYPQGISLNYSFSKVDANTIIWNNTGMTSVELQKQ